MAEPAMKKWEPQFKEDWTADALKFVADLQDRRPIDIPQHPSFLQMLTQLYGEALRARRRGIPHRISLVRISFLRNRECQFMKLPARPESATRGEREHRSAPQLPAACRVLQRPARS